MQLPNCELCTVVSTDPRGEGIDRRIKTTDNFCAFVSKGPLGLGHLLITPKEHYWSMATVPAEHFDELRMLREELGTRLTSVFHYPQTILFEHGSSRHDAKAGCCISHAHMHIMPTRLPSTRAVRKIKETLVEFRTFESYGDLRKMADEDTAYTFFEFDGIKYFFEIKKDIPSQFVRRVIGKYVGREYTWDWRQNPRVEDIIETVQRLKNN